MSALKACHMLLWLGLVYGPCNSLHDNGRILCYTCLDLSQAQLQLATTGLCWNRAPVLHLATVNR